MAVSKERITEKALQAMITDGWAMMSSGDVQAPTGYFAAVTVDGREVTVDGYSTGDEELDEWLASTEAIGHYMVTEDNYGNVFVSSTTKGGIDKWFAEQEARFERWEIA